MGAIRKPLKRVIKETIHSVFDDNGGVHPIADDCLILETGDYILLESGNQILLDSQE